MRSGHLLEVEDLTKHFPHRFGTVRAVDGVALHIDRGETLALVGESGCGKTTVGRLVLRLVDPTAGIIWLDGMDITDLRGQPLQRLRRRMQVVFQDPFASLNPRLTVGETLEEPLIVHERGGAMQRRARVNQLLGLVGLDARQAGRYPHQFSGGQLQRISIARALALEPSLLVCDEPLATLDVSVRAQIMNLLRDLQDRLRLGILFIARDLAVVRHMADRVAVMDQGRIVEVAPNASLFEDPRHPYTRALLAAVPRHRAHAVPPTGEPPGPRDVPPGCRFAPRCPHVIERCRREDPKLLATADHHLAACHLAATLPRETSGVSPVTTPAAATRMALYAARSRRAPSR